MADVSYGRNQQQEEAPTHAAAKAVAAAAAGGSMLVLSGLTLAATVVGLAVATPLLVIFSPVLVPAAIAAALVAAGFLTSGALGLAALSVLSWMYRYSIRKQPPGADQLEEARHRIAAKARQFKDQTAARQGFIHA